MLELNENHKWSNIFSESVSTWQKSSTNRLNRKNNPHAVFFNEKQFRGYE